MSVEIAGIYERTFFRNEYDGETIFSVKPRARIPQCNQYGTVTAKGKIPYIRKGTPLLVCGEWKDDAYGTTFLAESVREALYSELAAVEYLSSGIVPGIGPTIAKRIVDQLGAGLFQRLEDPNLFEELRKVRGVRPETALALVSTLKSTAAQRELFEYLLPFGGSCHLANLLFQRYGAQALRMLKAEPYETGKAAYLPLKVCDAIAKQENSSGAVDAARLEMIENLTVEARSMRGDTFEYQNALITQFQKNARTEYFPDELPAVVFTNIFRNNPKIVVEAGEGLKKVYLKQLRRAEINTAIQIHRLMEGGGGLPFREELIEEAERECGIQYAPQQREAFSLLKRGGVAVLTGGPGTGKTTVIKGLLTAYQKMLPDNIIRLCAPTGRAAQRMAETTGLEAVTIHRLLNYRPFGDAGNCICRDETDPIAADLIVVDEGSMVNIELASLFLSAVMTGALVLFVGDEDQLPAVGPGDVLHDLIYSETLPVCRLTTVYRQAETSYIVRNAHRINHGMTKLSENGEFYLKPGHTAADDIIKRACELYSKDDPFAVQILCPTHDGEAGVKALNHRLQELINPGTNTLKYGATSYRVDDKIILLRNNYDKGYYNGDIGQVTSVEDGLTVLIQGKEIRLSRENMADVSLAYAITIHKSQGSEFQHVLISLPNSYRMLTRNLLYTAVTRAKLSCGIFAEPGALETAVSTMQTGKRKSRLIERLQRPELRVY